MDTEVIKNSWQSIQDWLTQKLKSLGRPSDSAKIVAVSKFQALEKIQFLTQLGAKDFGENYVQEALEKQKALQSPKIHWHFIGHLQKNKVKQVVGQFHLIHSVDSLALAKKISDRALELNTRQSILLQIHQGEEQTKSGFSKSELIEQKQALFDLPGLNISGLMSMPPLGIGPETSRIHFRELKTILSDLQKESFAKNHHLQELSMGTSHDYSVAVEEGASLLRLGTLLFGDRPKNSLKGKA